MAAPQRLVLGVSSGIAAYKTPDLVRALRKRGVEVRVVLTASATALVGLEALRTVSGGPVYLDGAPQVHDMDHIRLAEWGEWMLVCPATANTIAKLAHGMADNLLTTLALSFERRLAVAPAMNTRMWDNAATQANLALLGARGATVFPVDSGELACGTWGAGRMLPVEAIADQVCALGIPRVLAGVKVLIGSGPTEEPIDPVRVLTNSSSGRMGAALAEAALAMGADVTFVTGPAPVAPPAGVRRIDVRTAREMQSAMSAEFAACGVCVMAAAVSDYRPEVVSDVKLSRERSSSMELRLVANPDILAALGAAKGSRVLVGFALESDEGMERARDKLARKNCDLLVLNHVDSSLGRPTSEATILEPGRDALVLGRLDKGALARAILERVAQLLERAHE